MTIRIEWLPQRVDNEHLAKIQQVDQQRLGVAHGGQRVQALFELSGGTSHPDSSPFTCPSGRASGGCWRPGAQRAIVVLTDASSHNGPTAGGGMHDPYPDSLGAATWAETRRFHSSRGSSRPSRRRVWATAMVKWCGAPGRRSSSTPANVD